MKTCSRCGEIKPVSAFSPKMSHCKVCCAEKRAIWRKANPERVAQENAAFRAANPDYYRQHYLKNADKEAARKAEYYAANKDKVRARLDRYQAQKPHVRTAITAKRRAKLLKATPLWADWAAIKAIYAEAAARDEPHEVDHIIPLQGKSVCGLHCEANLQVLPRIENRRKGARLL